MPYGARGFIDRLLPKDAPDEATWLGELSAAAQLSKCKVRWPCTAMWQRGAQLHAFSGPDIYWTRGCLFRMSLRKICLSRSHCTLYWHWLCAFTGRYLYWRHTVNFTPEEAMKAQGDKRVIYS